ncbi:MAG: hypothetical protein EG823_04625 [Actinobacteria bacterium]|nr:hypothetical protein [Actinomycetota bacterium]
MSDGTIRVVLLAAVGLAALLVLGYQVFMLRWTKKTAGSVPTIVRVLRVANVILILGTAVMVVWVLAGR